MVGGQQFIRKIASQRSGQFVWITDLKGDWTIEDAYKLYFRNTATYIYSNAVDNLQIVTPSQLNVISPYVILRNTGTGAMELVVRSNTDNASIDIDSGDDGGVEQSALNFKHDRTNRWQLIKQTDHHLELYDSIKGATIVEFQDNDDILITQHILLGLDDRIKFGDQAVYIYSDNDGELDLVADSLIVISAPDVRFSQNLVHAGDTNTKIQFTTDNIDLQAGGAKIFDMNATSLSFFGVTKQAQQAHIVDADGTLADITTKFNTLLADLEGYGLLASA